MQLQLRFHSPFRRTARGWVGMTEERVCEEIARRGGELVAITFSAMRFCGFARRG
jgi:hypothetical protein